MNHWRSLVCVTFLLMSLSASAASMFPQQFTARYSVSGNGRELGVMTRTVIAQGKDEFLFKSELKATHGLYALLRVKVLKKSRWQLRNGLVRPLSYSYKQSGPSSRQSQASFDWGSNVVRVMHKNKSLELPATVGMLDKLLYQLVLMRDLESVKNPVQYTVVDGSKVKHYPIDRLGEEIIDTPLGLLQTVKVQYHKPGSERTTTLWCAKSLHYLPVRLDHIEGEGERTSALIQSVTGLTGQR